MHALEQARRILDAAGMLIDLRPRVEGSSIKVISRREEVHIGEARATPTEAEQDRSADQALQEAARLGWFVCEHVDEFVYRYSWSTPTEMQSHVEQEWDDSMSIEDGLWQALRGSWAVADADAKPHLLLRMTVSRWRRT